VSDVQPIDLDDLRRVSVKVREKTDDNWLADMVEIAAAEISRLREENETLRDHWPTFWKPLPVVVKEVGK
jgi:hypothetical protein